MSSHLGGRGGVSILKLLWNTLVASVMSALVLLLLANATGNIGLLYMLIVGWWLLPPAWFAIIGTWHMLYGGNAK